MADAMIMSMTGYGRAEACISDISVVVEIKSVNHRYFEFSARLPRVYGFLEDKLKSLCQSKITRGKIDLFVTIDASELTQTNVDINHSLAKGYVAAIKELAETYELKDDFSAYSLAKFPDIFTIKRQAVDEDLTWSIVEAVANDAVDDFLKMREAEGKKLAADIESRVTLILEKTEFVEKKSPETVKQYREKLEARMREMLADTKFDEQRLLTETAIFADKVAVAEETVRLRSHMKQLHNMIESPDAVGRKLDFIVQEMNREVNTIGSKAQDVEIAYAVVDMKSEIEKIREQVQNIE